MREIVRRLVELEGIIDFLNDYQKQVERRVLREELRFSDSRIINCIVDRRCPVLEEKYGKCLLDGEVVLKRDAERVFGVEAFDETVRELEAACQLYISWREANKLLKSLRCEYLSLLGQFYERIGDGVRMME